MSDRFAPHGRAARSRPRISWLAALFALASCGNSEPALPTPETTSDSLTSSAQATTQDEGAAGSAQRPLSIVQKDLPAELAAVNHRWTGDFSGMAKRRIIRVLTVYERGGYFLDGAQERGLTFDLVRKFETFINERMQSGHLKIHVVLIPVNRDELLDGVVSGHGDIAAAGITITEQRRLKVEFSRPMSREISEVVITGPATPALSSLEDLAGTPVFVKQGSSHRASLFALSESLTRRGLEPIDVRNAPLELDDAGLLEMVNAGLLPVVVLDDFRARFWAEIFTDIEVRDDLTVNTGQFIGWAFRKNSPELAELVNEFARDHKQGTLVGNILLKRYLVDRNWVDRALGQEELSRFNETFSLFERYAPQYGFDPLLLVAQGYQESGLNQATRSRAGAIGVMQLLPSTAADPNVGIADIHDMEQNIHAGIKYMAFLRDRYFTSPELDPVNRTLFSFAAYNAGPARVRRLRQQASELGLDPNTWFKEVEIVAARDIGQETVQYVSNIYKYYLAYRLLRERQAPIAQRSR